MKLREIVRKLKEGPIISDTPRPPLRGLSFPQNDVRPGLPTPNPRIPVTWQRPAPTTSDVTGRVMRPDATWSRSGQVSVPPSASSHRAEQESETRASR